MRAFIISTLVLAFVLLTGACAGRQVRTRSVAAPSMTEPAVSALAPASMAEAPVAPADVIEPAPVAEAPVAPAQDGPKLTTQQMIDKYVAEEIAAHNAANRAAAEKLHRTPVPPAIGNDDEIVAALKFEPHDPWKVEREAAADLAAMLRVLDERVAALEAERPAARPKRAAARPRPKPKAAPAAEESGREAAVGSLASAPPALAQAVPAPAAPSIILAPRGETAAPETAPVFVPDRASVEVARAHWRMYLFGAMCAVLLGAAIGLIMTLLRNRRIAALAASPYDHLPDGAVVVQEVSGGRIVGTHVILPSLRASRSEPETSAEEAQKKMDKEETKFFAEGDAPPDDTPKEAPPIDDNFDWSDTPVEGPEMPAPAVPQASSEPKPPDDATPRFASGSGQLIASTPDAPVASGFIDAPDPPREPRSEPEVPAPAIIYEDDTSKDIAATTAAPTASN